MVESSLVDTASLIDTFGRVHRSLRISITDKCQLRCTYCMPAEGLPWISSANLLSPDEFARLAGLLRGCGFTDFRITGGEPLVRPQVTEIVRRIASLAGDGSDLPLDLSLTTNAVLLERYAADLKNAGLQRINVSLDTLHRDRFRELTLRDRLDDVLRGLDAARRAGLEPIKVNTLIMPGINDDEILDLADFALTNGYRLRFIEQMPLGSGSWDARTIITQQQILDTLSQRYELREMPGRGSAPAAEWTVDGGPATIGVIASVTSPFCGDCDRLRLSADGQLRTCLFSDRETDLRTPLRDGADDRELLDIMGMATLAKGAGHLIGRAGFTRPRKGMSQIGG